ncbi:hypothetical protein F5Y16DRAFT_248887 [Xylariaceae sp. FL0255]|nr:hypothetical protein F5Y16DRAFT_248887 [Xylariaceae sp. FL0255]
MGGLNLEVFKVGNPLPPPLNHCHSSRFLPIGLANMIRCAVRHVRHVPDRHHVLLRNEPRRAIPRAQLLAQSRAVESRTVRARRDRGRACAVEDKETVLAGPEAGAGTTAGCGSGGE